MSSEGVVYIVDDEEAVRRSIARLVRSVGLRAETFPSAQAFLAQKLVDEPACLVLDVRLPDQSGLDLQAAMGPSQRSIPIIFITGHGDIPMSVRAMKAGAVEFLTKPFRSRILLDAVRAAIDRDRAARKDRSEIDELRQRYRQLTPRECEVLPLVAAGLLNKQVAGKLATTERTIKFHRAHIMQKAQAESVADLVRMVEKLGIVRPLK